MSERIDRVVITGASSGIGFDLARRFLEQGARVVVNGRDEDRLARAAGALGVPDRVATVVGDVAEVATGRRLAETARERFGGVDVLVNNAGVFVPRPFLETTEDDLDRFYSINLKGTYLVTQAIVPGMIEAGSGCIINVGTVLVGQAMAGLPVSAAMASKGGVHALTVSWSAELAAHGIRVNTLAPGVIRTPLIGEGADSLADIHPLKRIGEVGDTSDAVLFLAASGFITGTVLEVDGGYAHGR
jgi:NAD(P)-dependent dehydrogenase (short-subunit alcohol dehydrogenase family)